MRHTDSVTTVTPWGKADQVTRYARGVNFYSTPGHGGFKLSKALNDKFVPDYFKNASFNKQGWQGWYEEDCDWAIVVVCLASWPGFNLAFTDREFASAHESLSKYLPAEYARFQAQAKAMNLHRA